MNGLTQIDTELLRRISATLHAMGTPGCRELAREVDGAMAPESIPMSRDPHIGVARADAGRS